VKICCVCGKEIARGESWTSAGGKVYHWECYKRSSKKAGERSRLEELPEIKPVEEKLEELPEIKPIW